MKQSLMERHGNWLQRRFAKRPMLSMFVLMFSIGVGINIPVFIAIHHQRAELGRQRAECETVPTRVLLRSAGGYYCAEGRVRP